MPSVPAARRGLPCARDRRFATRENARSFAERCQRGTVPVRCESCSGWHLTRLTEEQRAERQQRMERERLARVAAHLRTVRDGRRDP